MKDKKCKICRNKYTPRSSIQQVCGYLCAAKYTQQQKDKAWKKRKVKIKESIKTRSDHLKEAQKEFNRYIRLRDKDKPCISCLNALQHGKVDAGHYRSVGGCPELRFNEMNVHAQCVYCNRYLSANLINYRINLVKKIGVENVEFLEGSHEPLRLSVDDIKKIKKKYKEKCKKLS